MQLLVFNFNSIFDLKKSILMSFQRAVVLWFRQDSVRREFESATETILLAQKNLLAI